MIEYQHVDLLQFVAIDQQDRQIGKRQRWENRQSIVIQVEGIQSWDWLDIKDCGY